jgi:NAD(P)-dependent dehydrogenase (short-subunit alcohol dehydrogenase family)
MEPLLFSGLKDKSALVVGGGFGMGRATARLLAAHGTRVCVLDADPERVEATSRELSATGITADIREPGAARDAVKQAVTELGGLDILVNIVGRGRNVSGAELTAQTQREVFEINYLHHVEFCAAFGEHRLKAEKPGVITMVSSLAGLRPFPGEAAYGAAKAALNSLTTSLAVEWGPRQIRVNAVAPGIVRTDRNTWAGTRGDEIAQSIPLGRLGDQEEIAATIVFLCSDAASYITGQTLLVDGGASSFIQLWRRQ